MSRRTYLLAVWLLFALMVFVAAHAQTVDAADPAPSVPSAAKTPATEWLFQAALGADMLQTLDLHRVGLVETNGLLGSRPNESQIAAYFVTFGILHYLVTRELVRESVPSSIVTAWEAGTISLEMAYVKHNASLGIHFYLP